MRVVLDTNVLVSAVLFGGPRDLLVSAIRGELAIVTSPVLLDELEGLLRRKFGFGGSAARATRAEFELLAQIVEPTEVPDICRDPDDNEVLAAATTGEAEAIVTGDEDLLALRSFGDVAILTPAEFGRRLGPR